MPFATGEYLRNPRASATLPCPWTRGTICYGRVQPPSTNWVTTRGEWISSSSTLDPFGSPATSCAITFVLATWRKPGKHLRNWAMTTEIRSSTVVSTTRRPEMWTTSPGSLRRRFWPVPTPRTGTWLHLPSRSAERRTSPCVCSRAPSRDTTAPTMPCRMIPCSRPCEVRRSSLSCFPSRNSAGTISFPTDRRPHTELPLSTPRARGRPPDLVGRGSGYLAGADSSSPRYFTFALPLGGPPRQFSYLLARSSVFPRERTIWRKRSPLARGSPPCSSNHW